MALSFTNLITPNPKATLPVNKAVPSLLSSLSSAQSALTNKTQPSWQSTLSQVQSAPSWNSNTTKPSTGGQTLLPKPTSSQSLLPKAIPAQNNLASVKPLVSNLSQTNASVSSPVAPTSNINPNFSGLTGGSPGVSTPQQSPLPQPTPQPQQSSAYPALVNSLANQQDSSYNQRLTSATDAAGTLANTNPGTSGPAWDAYQQKVQALQDLKSNIAKEYSNVETSGIPLGFQQGREQVMARQYASQLDAAQQAVNEAQAGLGYQIQGQQTQNSGYQTAGGLATGGQGMAQGVLGTAAGYAAPVTQFGQLTSPQTGQVVGAGVSGNNPALENAVANAIQMVKNGASPADAQASLSGYGQAGTNAFNQAQQQVSQGTYNPTAQNAIVQQNVSQGQIYQGQAAELNKTLQQVDNLKPIITDFFSKTKFNEEDVPALNKSIATYIGATKDPVGKNFMNQLVADINNYTSQILSDNTGLIPTAVSHAIDSFDPSGLNKDQIIPYLENLQQLGQIRLQPIQQASAGSYGNQNGYTGLIANPTNNYSSGPEGTALSASVNNPTVQGAIGSIMNIIGTGEDLIKGIAGTAAKILK